MKNNIVAGTQKVQVEMLKNHYALNTTSITEQPEGDGTTTLLVSSYGTEDMSIKIDDKTGKAISAWVIWDGEEIEITDKTLAQSLYSSISKEKKRAAEMQQASDKLSIDYAIKTKELTSVVHQPETKDTEKIFVSLGEDEIVVELDKKAGKAISVRAEIDGESYEITVPKLADSIYKAVQKKTQNTKTMQASRGRGGK